MVDAIQSIFIEPPIAVARLGGSTVPQDAYLWAETSDPRADGDNAIAPAWSLNVLPDGSIEPTKPTEIRFRDGALIRPVCPFFEVWALVGEASSAAETWREVPLTLTLLAQHRMNISALTIRVDAHNLKAARRTRNPQLGFGTHPAVEITGDQHQPVVLFGVSSPGAKPPMIPNGRNIPLGSVQVLRSQPNPPDVEWKDFVNLETIRLRFTPGRGQFYGPPQATRTTSALRFPAVEAANGFLDPKAGWFGARMTGIVQPSDTYDGSERNNNTGPSLGVVDDTCEARIEVSLMLPRSRTPLRAGANVFVGPPDFGPDRRPFLSLSDELNDRSADAASRSAAMNATQRDAWVEDLFERIYETVSLFNVDHYRSARGITLTGDRLAPPLAQDGVPVPRRAMGGEDKLRNPLYTVPAPTPNEPLPLSKHARRQHRAISDLQNLRDFVLQTPGRIQTLVRAPFQVERGEDTAERSTMRMPPFMRQSNALPLTLSNWQYQLLMDWVAVLEAAGAAPHAGLSEAASRRRDAVLARVKSSEGSSP
jgi:hypothetical protein